jgi:transcriptional regulator with PAS, ATPase and Fis domain
MCNLTDDADDESVAGLSLGGLPMQQTSACNARKTSNSVPGKPASIIRSVEDLASLLQPISDNGSHIIAARSPVMLDILEQTHRYAKSSATVLLTGESGTGKELIAKIIQANSPRMNRPFARVNCAALSEGLVESELFGHERGAFTGASETRVGRFEWADGGTILLDEITEIPISLQAKLLRVLEEEEYQRVGGNETHHVDVRIIATTNRSLAQEVAAGRFRTDLYYRLNVLELRLPPLRDRPDDIPGLAALFLDRFRDEATVPITHIAQETLEILSVYEWPGNIRQLRNVIQRACVLNRTGVIRPEDLPPLGKSNRIVPEPYVDMSLADVERHVIISNLQKFNGNKTAAAKQLGVTSRTLSNKIKRYRNVA